MRSSVSEASAAGGPCAAELFGVAPLIQETMISGAATIPRGRDATALMADAAYFKSLRVLNSSEVVLRHETERAVRFWNFGSGVTTAGLARLFCVHAV